MQVVTYLEIGHDNIREMLFSNRNLATLNLEFYLTFAEKRYLSGYDTCLFSTQERIAEIGTFLKDIFKLMRGMMETL